MTFITLSKPPGQPTTRGNGPSHAELTLVNGQPQPLVFAVGAAGERMASVRVTIRDQSGTAVASFALASLSGTQNIIWTPRPGSAAGGYAAYWEGASLTVETA